MAPGVRLVRWAARLVPLARRDAWRREWEAEVTFAWRRLRRSGRAPALAAVRLRIRVLSCVIDALWERKEKMTTTGTLEDLRFAVRSLLRHRTFTAIAVLTLALGIGANTAVFTLVDGVLLSPLPFDQPDRLIQVSHLGRDGQDELPISEGLYVLYRDQASTLDEIGLYTPYAGTSVNLVVEGEPRRVPIQAATPSFFAVLGAGAALGRTFTEEEGGPGGEQVVLLSDGLWRELYGPDPSAVGRSLDVNGTSRRIVGVMPPDFGYPDRSARLWLPLVVDPVQAPLAAFSAAGVARRSPDATLDAVQSELQGLIARLGALFPDSGAPAFLEQVGLRAVPLPLKDALVGDVRTVLWVLLGTVGFVLLIACANVANLLLVRAEGRQRELALRVAIGAGRAQILRASLSESLLLAGAGGFLAVGLASVAVDVTLDLVPADLPRVAEIGVDPAVLLFTAGVSLGCALLFGLVPLGRHGGGELAARLRDGAAHGSTGGRGRHRLRNALVVAQMALALVLLVGSGLMVRSFQALSEVDPGFDPGRVLTARLAVPSGEVEGWEETARFFRDLGERLAAQPGVEAAGFAAALPLDGGIAFYSIEVEDHPRGPGELPILSSNNFVEPGYLEALGIDLVEGRLPERGDGAEGTRSIVVSASFAARYWPGASALGRRARLGFGDEEWYTIVGVVADATYASLEGEPEEVVYWPTTVGPAESPQPIRALDVVVKTAADPLGFVPVLRREAQAINPRIPVASPTTMADRMRGARARISFTMSLLGTASAIALLLGLVGIYGVVSYVVSQRTREIGVRMALGATGPSVRSMVVRQGMALAAIGAGLGLAAAGALSRLMASLLYGVSATDPLTYATVAAALVAVTLLACWVPARRAAGVDPSIALRAE